MPFFLGLVEAFVRELGHGARNNAKPPKFENKKLDDPLTWMRAQHVLLAILLALFSFSACPALFLSLPRSPCTSAFFLIFAV